jgi:hypothetical protein
MYIDSTFWYEMEILLTRNINDWKSQFCSKAYREIHGLYGVYLRNGWTLHKPFMKIKCLNNHALLCQSHFCHVGVLISLWLFLFYLLLH